MIFLLFLIKKTSCSDKKPKQEEQIKLIFTICLLEEELCELVEAATPSLPLMSGFG